MLENIPAAGSKLWDQKKDLLLTRDMSSRLMPEDVSMLVEEKQRTTNLWFSTTSIKEEIKSGWLSLSTLEKLKSSLSTTGKLKCKLFIQFFPKLTSETTKEWDLPKMPNSNHNKTTSSMPSMEEEQNLLISHKIWWIMGNLSCSASLVLPTRDSSLNKKEEWSESETSKKRNISMLLMIFPTKECGFDATRKELLKVNYGPLSLQLIPSMLEKELITSDQFSGLPWPPPKVHSTTTFTSPKTPSDAKTARPGS